MRQAYIKLNALQRNTALGLLCGNWNEKWGDHQNQDYRRSFADTYNRLSAIPPVRSLGKKLTYVWPLADARRMLLTELNHARNRLISENKDLETVNEVIVKVAKAKLKDFSEEPQL